MRRRPVAELPNEALDGLTPHRLRFGFDKCPSTSWPQAGSVPMILSRPTRVVACAWTIVLGLDVSAGAGDDPRTFDALKRDHQRQGASVRDRFEKAATEPEREAAQEAIWDEVRGAAANAFAWAEAHPGDPESIDAIVWTVHGLANGYYPEYHAEIERAYELLERRALASEKVAPVCYYSADAGFACPSARRFLETALEKSPSRLVRGAACLGLARTHHKIANFLRLAGDPVTRKRLVESRGAALVAKYQGGDASASEARAEAYFLRLIAEFGDLKMPSPYNETPFEEMAEGELYELRHLGIGKPAPDLEGEGVDGRKLCLSNFRGKVVVVVFWASWCGPCMAMVPHERELVARMKDRPFVLLGVNGDDDREATLELTANQRMNWPSLWNGGQTGGFVSRLGVRSWPTIYVIDARGIIRSKNVRGKALDEDAERLVSEAEAVQRP